MLHNGIIFALNQITPSQSIFNLIYYHMKTVSITIFLFIVMCTGCKKDATIVKGFYDSMHFVREGGGQIEFIIYSTDSSDKLKAVVTKYDFRDTTIQIIIDINNEIALSFSSLNEAMNNQIQINGDFQQSTLHTGTWAYIYLVSDNKETEVTNTELRNSLLKFEQLVKNKIQ
jgi:peroxiredoxin